MKVFISWSGELSQQLGEAIRDWIPNVLQLIVPYFTPADIEKGARWASDIAKELEASKVGILCVTRDNLHSDWILFEAGALSKTLEKTNVCPILFGITPTDLDGPLKQFQATTFNRADMHKLLSVINARLGDQRLAPKTFDAVFEKWWPDLDTKVNEILQQISTPDTPIRSERELIEEILLIVRRIPRGDRLPILDPQAITSLLQSYIHLHDGQSEESHGYQETLNVLKTMHKPIGSIAWRYQGQSEVLDDLIGSFQNLSYQASERPNGDGSDDVPF